MWSWLEPHERTKSYIGPGEGGALTPPQDCNAIAHTIVIEPSHLLTSSGQLQTECCQAWWLLRVWQLLNDILHVKTADCTAIGTRERETLTYVEDGLLKNLR